MDDWQPIETAPKDCRILGFGTLGLESTTSIGTVKWNSTYSIWNCDPNEAYEYDPEPCDVTYWMPLPDMPQWQGYAMNSQIRRRTIFHGCGRFWIIMTIQYDTHVEVIESWNYSWNPP